VAEVHAIEDGFRDLVTGNASLTALKDYTRQVGVVSLQEAAAQQVAQGSTTVEEVRRVVGWI
jgi:general secretion pathway protein E